VKLTSLATFVPTKNMPEIDWTKTCVLYLVDMKDSLKIGNRVDRAIFEEVVKRTSTAPSVF